MRIERNSENKRLPLWRHHPLAVVTCWLVLSFGIGLWGLMVGTKTEIPGPANRQVLESIAGEREARRAGIPPRDFVTILLQSDTVAIEDEQFTKAREALVSLLTDATVRGNHAPLFDHVVTAGHSLFDDERFLNRDNQALLIQAITHRAVDEAGADLEIFPDLITKFRSQHPLFTTSYLSAGIINNEMIAIINRDLDRSLLYTLPLTFLVLLWVFGSLIAAVMPLVVAGVSLICGLGAAALVSAWTGPISATAAQLVVLLVLAVGIDYALFFIGTIRERVSRGESYQEAILHTRASTGTAILWSGLVVALSLAGLYLMYDSVLASMATVAIVAVLVTMLGAVLVLPAMLLLLDYRLEWGKVPGLSSRAQGTLPNRWIAFAIHHPIVAAFSSIVALMTLACFAFAIRLGSTVEPPLLPPTSESFGSYQKIRAVFPDVVGVDLSIIFTGPHAASLEEDGAFEELLNAIRAYGEVSGPLQTVLADDGTVVRYQFVALGSANDQHNEHLIKLLREEWIPNLVPNGVSVSLSGTLPYAVDAVHTYRERTPVVFIVVIGLSAAFLLVAFRSIVIPIKAMALNLLSTGAAFGSLVIFFQYRLFGSQNYQVIESFVPGLLFSILFGLSMDYHVFLLSRLREEVERFNSPRQRDGDHEHTAAVRNALESTFATITGAALIMISVFAIIATLELPVMRELGVGLAIAILLDATLIRCFLLPASLVLLGRHNWYLPKWLSWLPRVRL